MKSSVVAAVVGLIVSVPLCADEHVTGAKELFFDPQSGAVSRASAAPASRKETSEPAKPVTKLAPATRPAAERVVDKSGRRLVRMPAEPEKQDVLGLSYWIELADPDGGDGVQVTESRVFKSGDRIRLHFRSNADGRICLIQLGASGSSSVLFPDVAKGLSDNVLKANSEYVLPTEKHWFRFDSNPGVERLVVLFAKSQAELDASFPTWQSRDAEATTSLLRTANGVRGSKDLFIETETERVAEVGTYAVNVAGKPVVLEIALKHQ